MILLPQPPKYLGFLAPAAMSGHVGQAGLECLASSDLPVSASQSAWITGMNHHAWPIMRFFKEFLLFFLPNYSMWATVTRGVKEERLTQLEQE